MYKLCTIYVTNMCNIIIPFSLFPFLPLKPPMLLPYLSLKSMISCLLLKNYLYSYIFNFIDIFLFMFFIPVLILIFFFSISVSLLISSFISYIAFLISFSCLYVQLGAYILLWIFKNTLIIILLSSLSGISSNSLSLDTINIWLVIFVEVILPLFFMFLTLQL